jgi:peptide/nickel transport system permease protein
MATSSTAGAAQTTIADKKRSAEERYYYASQRELIWWRFTRHKAAVVGAIALIILYLGALFADFISPYTMDTRFEGFQAAPPTELHLIKPDGGIQPYVFGMQRKLDQKTFKWIYTADTSQIYPIRFFVRGEEYKLLGLFKTDTHLFGVEGAPIFLFGTDRLSRDLFSRTWAGARISLSIGLVGVFISFTLGVLLGGISGYFGGMVDDAIQRVIDFLIAIPGLPLWMTLSAALPRVIHSIPRNLQSSRMSHTSRKYSSYPTSAIIPSSSSICARACGRRAGLPA